MSHAEPPERPAPGFLAGGGEMGALIRAHDWAATPLGVPEAWPQSLRTAVRIMLTSRQPIWIGWGPQLIYLYNDAYQSIIGGKHPWALGKPTSEVWREIWTDIGPMLATAMGGIEGTYVEEQLLIMERNGYPEETYYTFSYSPIPDDDGNPGGIICANADDTQRVIGERQLALLRDLAANTADARSRTDACERGAAALATDPHDLVFALLYIDGAEGAPATLAAAAGLPKGHPAAPAELPRGTDRPWPVHAVMRDHETRLLEDLADRFGGDLPKGPWERAPARAAVLALPSKGETGRAGALVVGLNPYRLFDSPYRGFLGLVAGQIAAALSNADAYEEERRRAEALAELDRAKTLFFSNVSHEFRTPLTLMLGPLEEVLSGAVPPNATRAQVELAHRNGTRLLRLVNSLLDFSRIESGRARASFEPTDLGAFSAEIASSFRSAIERAGMALEIRRAPLPHPVHVDREMWEKILLNLLSNAFKFTFAGRIAVAVAPSADGRAAVVRVSDTGIGIPAEELPKLFERFHRVEGAQGRSFEGSGIGLALVHELVRLHGGTIAAESTPGVGTTFTVTLPFGRAHLPADQVREASTAAVAATRAHAFVEEALRWLPDVAPAMEEAGGLSTAGLGAVAAEGGALPGLGKRVLLADDNTDMRGYVVRLLTAQGYAVEAVPDGAAALEAARATPPDLVLTDVMMPRLDGFGLLRALRADQATAGLPVIMLSARAGEEAKVEGLEAGADDYLIKPFAARELLARVTANIQMAELRREANRAIFRSEQRYLITQDRLSLALSTGRVAVFEWEVAGDRVAVLGPLAEAFGVDPRDASTAGLPLATFTDAIHPDDRARVQDAIRRTIATGEPYEAEYRLRGLGGERIVVARGSVSGMPGGELRLTGALIDVTGEKSVERELREKGLALEEQTRTLQILNRAAAAVAGDLDLERLVQTVTDAGVEVTGAQFGAFFYNVVDAAGERYTLYSLSGVPREHFSNFPMPRATAVFEPTFLGTAVVRSDDITKDARYGHSAPYHGMPKGHLPVRSYLAVPVRSRSGEVLGGLFFGHSTPGVFTSLSEERVVGLASQASVAMDNARLFQATQTEIEQRRRAESELQALNAGLEERVAREVAERVKAEDALRQAQKMEAVGQLTGGVAHDFNNLLTVIIGGLDTIRRSRPGDEARIRRSADMALQGAQRAASLTGRLLAFSRRQPLEPKPLDLNLLVRDMTELLHRTLGEHIELEGVLAPRLWTIEADQNQLESAIINLAVNARDAMPDGGKLTIETANTALDESYAATDAEVIPGQYVVIAVSDSGAGMPKETLTRVFEPFFTTKEVGRGTGLGLSMVYGFVKQSGGHVTIYSEEGQGTTVRLYFPRFMGGAQAASAAEESDVPLGSQEEVVLVVEDNDDVRAYSVMILTELGYRVLEVAEADSALALLATDQRVDLLFTDVVLPGRSGRMLADAAAALRPGLKVLFTTGYSRNAIVHHGRLDPGVQLITKPFTFEQLATRVRDLLDRG
ncbi:ATP-binding protein [Muricoccus radiodurans]|uniref:ATP-binding protein n=1 Tax=Muricoccus radiodurans TaxID=2231721 RepID=UPI003CF2E053